MIVTAMKIKLTRGGHTIVDGSDFKYLSQFNWHKNHYGYAVRSVSGGRKILMHREIMDTPKGLDTDHINHNPLDNRKVNLRVCEHGQNQANHTIQKNNTSGFKGVYWHNQRQKWWARLQYKGKQRSLGLYSDKIDAAKAYNRGAIQYFGEYANLNIGVTQ